MQTQSTVIALGANLGAASGAIRQAMCDLDALENVAVKLRSGIYRSKPMTMPDDDESQPDYMNAIVYAEVDYEPLALLDDLQRIESQYGRVRKQRWGARSLDLDMITYGERKIESRRLTVPHPDAYRRCFVLAPLFEIMPDYVIPGYGKVAELLPRCETGAVEKVEA